MWKPYAGMAALATFVALVITWPLALNGWDSIPAESSRGTVPLFNLWTYNWNADALMHGYRGYWDAEIFYPEPNSFALSEPQPVTGAIYAALRLVLQDQILAYNALVLLALIGNGLSVFVLARTLGTHVRASQLAGALGTSLPFAFQELGVLQLVMIWPIILSLTALFRFSQAPSFRNSVALGIAVALTFLTCSYYALFLSVFLLMAPFFLATKSHLSVRVVSMLTVSVVLAVVLVAPVLIPQRVALAQYTRETDAVVSTSAKMVEYFQLSPRDWRRNIGSVLGFAGGPSHYLYPGSGLLLAAIAGCCAIRCTPNSRWVLYCGVGVIVAVILSISPRLTIGDTSVFDAMALVYPGFQQLRNVYRFGVFVPIFLLTFAILGLGYLWKHKQSSARWLATGLVGIGVWEVAALPLPLYEVPRDEISAPWVRALAVQPRHPLVVIPVYQGERASGYEETVVAMIQGLDHRKPLLQGYSGFFPDSYETFRDEMKGFPDEKSLSAMRARNVGYVAMTTKWLTDERRTALENLASGLTWIHSDSTHAVASL